MLAKNGVFPDANRDLGMDIDPLRLRRQLLAPLTRVLHQDRHSVYYSNPQHQYLVETAGVDFGDPQLALCELQEVMVWNWLTWAKQEGWIP